jgi:hypothetical protein
VSYGSQEAPFCLLHDKKNEGANLADDRLSVDLNEAQAEHEQKYQPFLDYRTDKVITVLFINLPLLFVVLILTSVFEEDGRIDDEVTFWIIFVLLILLMSSFAIKVIGMTVYILNYNLRRIYRKVRKWRDNIGH